MKPLSIHNLVTADCDSYRRTTIPSVGDVEVIMLKSALTECVSVRTGHGSTWNDTETEYTDEDGVVKCGVISPSHCSAVYIAVRYRMGIYQVCIGYIVRNSYVRCEIVPDG